MQQLLNIQDFEKRAKQLLNDMAWGYYSSGADAEITLAKNQQAWQDILVRPRCLVGVANPSLQTTVLGQPINSPMMVAPMAFQQLAHPLAERAVAQAAGKVGSIYCLSTFSNTPVEEVVAHTTGPVWFQLYVERQRERSFELIQRVQEAGCQALVLTVDTPVIGNREIDRRIGFSLPNHLRLPHLPAHVDTLTQQYDAKSALAHFAQNSLDSSLTWKDLEDFAQRCPLPIVVKGVLRADDARKAVEHGAQGIIVSNHGGRQFDTAIPTAWALPEIVAAVNDQVEVYVDGGIRCGSDILKAISLGARAVLIGRPVLWGLAVDGERGVSHVLQLLADELTLAMQLTGAPNIMQLTRDLLAT